MSAGEATPHRHIDVVGRARQVVRDGEREQGVSDGREAGYCDSEKAKGAEEPGGTEMPRGEAGRGSWRPHLHSLQVINQFWAKAYAINIVAFTWSELPLAMTFMSAGPSPPSPELDNVCRPQDKHETKRSCASILRMQRPVLISQMRMVWSSEDESRYLPFGWKTSPRTQSSWPTCAEGQHMHCHVDRSSGARAILNPLIQSHSKSSCPQSLGDHSQDSHGRCRLDVAVR